MKEEGSRDERSVDLVIPDEHQAIERGEIHKKARSSSCCSVDGSSIEVARRPRGRPPGSKNKPKPPLFISRDAGESCLRPHILQVPGGLDVVDAVTRYARRRGVGFCVLNGNGSVANVSLRQRITSATVNLHGCFEILSISATFLPPPSPSSSTLGALSSLSDAFVVSLVGAQGQIFGGSVVGPLVAAGTVMVVAAAFVNPSFHRLPADDEFSVSGASPVPETGVADHHLLHDQAQQYHNPRNQRKRFKEEEDDEREQRDCHDPRLLNSSGGTIFTCHLPSDAIWAPIARPPPPPPY